MKYQILSISVAILTCVFIGQIYAIPKLSADKPTVVVGEFGWSENQDLVLQIQIFAPTQKPLRLGKVSTREFEETIVFTTKESHLTDLWNQKKVSALQRIPSDPNYGRVKTATTVKAGAMMQFTGAYEKPLDPPQKKDGKTENYRLRLMLPLNLPSVEFEIPFGVEKGQVIPIKP